MLNTGIWKEEYIGEIFVKFVKDKELMFNILRDIFIKNSEFINIDDNKKPSDYKLIKTTKIKTIPYYITRLFTPETAITFKLDSDGSDLLNLKEALSSLNVNIPQKITKNYLAKNDEDKLKIIIRNALSELDNEKIRKFS